MDGVMKSAAVVCAALALSLPLPDGAIRSVYRKARTAERLVEREQNKEYRAWQRARKAQFKEEAWHRRRLSNYVDAAFPTLPRDSYAVCSIPGFDPAFAAGNRAMIAQLQAKEAKENAPKRRRGRPITTHILDHWFNDASIPALLDVASARLSVNDRDSRIKANEAVSDALWLACRKLRRNPTAFRFESQEKFNSWLASFVRNTTMRYQDDRWGDITRRRKENIVIASGMDVVFADLQGVGTARKPDIGTQDKRGYRDWIAKGPR